MVDNNNSSQADDVKYDNLLDYLSLYQFPLALKFGMTPEQFWEDDPDYFWAYLDAYEMKQKEQAEYDNALSYRQGIYMAYAIGQAFADKGKRVYPKEPLPLFDSANKQQTKQSINDKWNAYIMSTLKVSQSKQK